MLLNEDELLLNEDQFLVNKDDDELLVDEDEETIFGGREEEEVMVDVIRLFLSLDFSISERGGVSERL